MSVLYSSFFILINFCSIILAKQHVPVLCWSPSVSLPSVPAVKQFSSVGFSEVLQDALVTSQPLIAVFLEDELSSEEFRERSSLGKTLYDDLESAGINDNMLYLPSVVKPMDALKELWNNGYDKLDYKGNIPSDISKPTIVLVDLHDSSKKHDDASYSKEIINIYNKIVKSYPEMLAIYTGKHNNWSEKLVKRVRRDTPAVVEDDVLLMQSENFVAIVKNITYKKDEATAALNLTSVVSATLTNKTESIRLLEVLFKEGVNLTLSFTGSPDNWQWYLSEILHGDGKRLVPSIEIWAPRKWSWHCAQEVYFAASPLDKSDDKAVVTITGLQVQAYLDKEQFGQAIDCVPYFSIAIWTGIVVVLLMLAILSWGLIMLMDINNNDRFDDPKGKTITISANE